ncbi:MAG: DNA-3-methyladenine glycosylase I [Deltaproteobacteria bacterium]|nr:DNA-3-methyladenine glycosylase I [Deltaproteobacteria bacterium]
MNEKPVRPAPPAWPPGAPAGPDGLARCPWALADPLSMAYHDLRWGRPEPDDDGLFRMLVLEGMQAGLSWSLILKKEAAIVEAFEGLTIDRVASFGPEKVAGIMGNPGVIRNRAKIASAIGNARACQALAAEYGSLSGYLWSYVGHRPVVNPWENMGDIQATTALSDRLSRDLKKRGFKFVGSTITYSFMQAVGMVNDHLAGCAFRFPGGGPQSP